MTARISAVFRITLRFVQKTYLFLCCQDDRLESKSSFSKKIICINCNRRCYRLRSQIKDSLCKFLSHGFYRRKKHCQCLSCACRRLHKKLLFMIYRLIHVCRKFLLTFSVIKRKFHRLDRISPRLRPLKSKICPFAISVHN